MEGYYEEYMRKILTLILTPKGNIVKGVFVVAITIPIFIISKHLGHLIY